MSANAPASGRILGRIGEGIKALRMPRVKINLMASATAANDPFYARLVSEFYAFTRKRHPHFPVVRRLQVGVALCDIRGGVDGYISQIESSANRNVKKAMRHGYVFRRMDYNACLADVKAIRASAPVRQGPLPKDYLDVVPCNDPPSRTDVHDYVYYGIFLNDTLVAYAGCFVCGEICMVEQLLGHSDHLSNGVVPMLLVETVREVCLRFRNVKYCSYGTFYGAGASMRRFKKKFGFLPHRVSWTEG